MQLEFDVARRCIAFRREIDRPCGAEQTAQRRIGGEGSPIGSQLLSSCTAWGLCCMPKTSSTGMATTTMSVRIRISSDNTPALGVFLQVRQKPYNRIHSTNV